jgi:uncharacterized membrane protein (DUF485 family)
MKCFGAFALAAWAGFVVASAISIFELGSYERVYGPSTTFVMVLWYAAFPSLLAGASGWLGTLGRKRRATTLPAASLIRAALVFGVVLASLTVVAHLVPVAIWLIYPWTFLAPFAITRFAFSRYGILPPAPITGEGDAALDVPGLGADAHTRPQ